MSPSPESSFDRGSQSDAASRRWAIIADDLTGACDAAVAFASAGYGVRVNLGLRLDGDTDVCAISTETRDIDGDRAVARIRAIADDIPSGREIFKKIDSVLRGNTFAEIIASAQGFSADLVLIAPAYPAMGRYVVNGRLIVEDTSGVRKQPIAEELIRRGCVPACICGSGGADRLTSRLRQLVTAGDVVVLADAQTQSELTDLVCAAGRLGLRVLWIGSGGLAHALAAGQIATTRVETPRLRGSVLLFIGSDHPVTREQVLHLQRISKLEMQPCTLPALAGEALLLDVVRGQTSEDQIRNALTNVAASEVGCLFLTGGDTARLVCEALGITSLRLQHEFAPGIPLGIAEGGRFDGTPVVLKSGGFGQPDVLSHVIEAFRRKEETLAQTMGLFQDSRHAADFSKS